MRVYYCPPQAQNFFGGVVRKRHLYWFWLNSAGVPARLLLGAEIISPVITGTGVLHPTLTETVELSAPVWSDAIRLFRGSLIKARGALEKRLEDMGASRLGSL